MYALTLNTVVSSVLGIAYWALAARLYSPREVGVGTAMVSTMMFLSNLSQLNLNGALARFLPAAGPHRGRLVGYAYGLSYLAALLVSGGFLLIAPLVSDELGFLARTPLLAAAFVLAVAAWGSSRCRTACSPPCAGPSGCRWRTPPTASPRSCCWCCWPGRCRAWGSSCRGTWRSSSRSCPSTSWSSGGCCRGCAPCGSRARCPAAGCWPDSSHWTTSVTCSCRLVRTRCRSS
ncbi:lipopolysaccharide biosynthesis protein [Catellatospora bangladeshensis]|uniref:lipopolysaccharide biosynthesis protein n=1 Tax=Catellatospora bangladeshensis TaxID=310355 RepID=UPI0036200BE6